MTTPLNGSTEQIAARAMTNDTLAHRVSMLVSNRRSFDKKLADAILAEAATRLTWPDNYAKHVDAGKVDRMKAATASLQAGVS